MHIQLNILIFHECLCRFLCDKSNRLMLSVRSKHEFISCSQHFGQVWTVLLNLISGIQITYTEFMSSIFYGTDWSNYLYIQDLHRDNLKP